MAPEFMPQIDDIVASVVLMLSMMRRVGVKWLTADQFPALEPTVFDAWRTKALGAYRLVAIACGAKVVANLIWAFVAVGKLPKPVMVAGGLLQFVVWVIVTTVGWKRVTDAKAEQKELGIDPEAAARAGRG